MLFEGYVKTNVEIIFREHFKNALRISRENNGKHIMYVNRLNRPLTL